MRTLAIIHRWTGGLIGLLLALLGATGTILAFKDWWVSAPGAGDIRPQTLAEVERVATAVFAGEPGRPDYIIFASDSFGLHRTAAGDAGAYLDATGRTVASWNSVWDRPELWLFDLHHYLLAGDPGKIVAGTAGLVGLGFIVTGIILWWRTRRTFEWRLWPRRMTRPSVVRHHRDLGLVASPLLFVTCLTGAMMALKPVGDLVVAPLSSPAEREAALAPPQIEPSRGPAANLDWARMLGDAKARFPNAAFRILAVPSKAGAPITLRMKQPGEWLPNGRTMLWFDPADGRLLRTVDALALPAGAQAFNMVYPLHSGKVGGLAWTIAIALAGLALTLLGTLATWSFWFGSRSRPARIVQPAVALVPAE